jgi:hypothetical protein
LAGGLPPPACRRKAAMVFSKPTQSGMRLPPVARVSSTVRMTASASGAASSRSSASRPSSSASQTAASITCAAAVRCISSARYSAMLRKRPFAEQRDVLVGEATALVHAEMAVLRHRDQRLQQVRAALGARQERVIPQGLGRPAQVAAAAVLQRQAHQVDQARTGLLQLRTQVFAAEVARDLHHALGRIRADGVQPGAVDQAVLHAVMQRLFEERPRIVQRDGGRGNG